MRPVDPGRAYERLDAILARDEYQEYVSPIMWLFKAFDLFSEWFADLSIVLQIIVLGVLIAILLAILFHFVMVFGRVMRATRAEAGTPLRTARTIKDLPAAAVLLDRALSALESGDRAEALRLFYLHALARLRQKGRIPLSTSLTGREILAATRPPLAGLEDATSLFEACVYGSRVPGRDEVLAVQRLGAEVT
ncbi:MAG: DUF4129 domain-containing protein [Deltaproteobacteria bacterium]|nr:DUF4129 domain-containing protein [Deltaproteobacteria bacterium]